MQLTMCKAWNRMFSSSLLQEHDKEEDEEREEEDEEIRQVQHAHESE